MPVLGTKLHVPAMRRRLVPRPRLTDRLRVEPTSMPRLVLVSAPAGFGKTTLIAQWLASSERGDEEDKPAGPLGYQMKSITGQDVDLSKYKGQVVLMVNVASKCGLTPQYENLESMYEKYKDKGLVIVGVHSPEFAFEQSEANVRRAMSELKPVKSVRREAIEAMPSNYSNSEMQSVTGDSLWVQIRIVVLGPRKLHPESLPCRQREQCNPRRKRKPHADLRKPVPTRLES